jgi:hypothetical protein
LKEKKLSKSQKTITELFAEDPWIRSFMQEIYDMFGMPVSSSECYSKTDKIMFVWSMMCLVQAMQKDNSWNEMRKEIEPDKAAELFVREHFEKNGRLLLDNLINEEQHEGEENEV